MTDTRTPEHEQPRRDFEAQIPYADLVNPQLFGLDTDNFSVTPEAAAAADVENFERWLIDPDVNKFADPKQALYATYTPEGQRRDIVVPLTEQEHKRIIRAKDPRHLSRGVLSTVLSGKQALNPDVRKAIDDAADIGDGAIEQKVAAMLDYLRTLENRDRELDKFIESSFNAGLNRRKDIDTRIAATDVFFLQIPEMLRVIGMLKGWDTDKFKLAEKSVHYRMFFDREGNAHLKYGRQLLDLMSRYNKAKVALFLDRVEAAGVVLSGGES